MDTQAALHRHAAVKACVLGALLALGSTGAAAQAAEDVVEEAATVAVAPRFELTAEPVRRLDAIDGGMRVEAIGWAAGDAHAFGVALGSQFDRTAALPWQDPQMETALHVGLRWRSTLSDRRRVDVAAWRRFAAAAGDERAGVTTRIEMQFTSPRSKVGLGELGAIGMQLDGNAKLQLKIRRGKPMFYYRSKF